MKKLFFGKTTNGIIRNICGKKLGEGVHRTVYQHKYYPNLVVKIEHSVHNADFANVTEWRNYINNREWKFLADFLAPCEAINETGEILIQQKTEPLKRGQAPKEVPVLFTDLKKSNWGMLNGRQVCHDYSFFPIYFIVKGGKKMKKPKWFK